MSHRSGHHSEYQPHHHPQDHGRTSPRRAAVPHQAQKQAGYTITHVRGKLARGETVYLAGLGLPGTHNAGVSLVEVTQAHGPRLILNNEEERFSGNKHTTEYPRWSVDAMVTTLRGMPRERGRRTRRRTFAAGWGCASGVGSMKS